jgi:hypothetical protein
MKRFDEEGMERDGSPRRKLAQLSSICIVLGALLVGCGGAPEETAPGAAGVDESSEALRRGGGGGGKLGFSCSKGVCTCDKSIENDCEDMSAVCTEDTLGGLIQCIDGWLTTDCTCTQAFKSPTSGTTYTPTTGGVNIGY